MNKFNLIKNLVLTAIAALSFTACVHDDDYDVPPVTCDSELSANISIEELKAMYLGSPLLITQDLILEGYVSSSDESGNIYKNLFIQNTLEDPTQGFTISLDVTNAYTYYPEGGKVYIKLQGLYLGEYGGVVQLGDVVRNEEGEYEFDRMSVNDATSKIVRACGDLANVVPKQVSISDFNDALIGTLIQINNMEVKPNYLCETYALPETTVNVLLQDCNDNEVTLRNSGFANFASDILPGGNGSITGILSKYVSYNGNVTWQIYIRDTNDVDMENTRCDGTDFSCTPPQDNANIQDLKDLYSDNTIQVTEDMNITATITANDATGNFFKLLYLEDETGGIQLRLDKTDMFLNPKYQVGNVVTIAAKDLYVGTYNGEFQLGDENGSAFRIPEENIYKHVFYNQETAELTPNTIGIQGISANLVGSLVSFENVEFAENELGEAFAPSGTTNRTFQDCDGNTLIIRTSGYANFADEELPSGNGKLTGILSVYGETYQVWIRDLNDIDFNSTRCDGTTPPQIIFNDTMDSLSNFTTINVTGAQTWEAASYGDENFAKISGYSNGSSNENEDWLISNAIAIPSSVATASLSFDTAKNYSGNDLEVFYSNSFTGDVSTTSWTQLNPALSTGGFEFVNSGSIDVSDFIGENLYLAFKYTSTDSASATWEVDNVKVVVTTD